MIPKIESCEISLNGGAVSAVILNGTKPEQIEEYAVHQQQVGTTIKR
jgi:acetylglutamate kinase